MVRRLKHLWSLRDWIASMFGGPASHTETGDHGTPPMSHSQSCRLSRSKDSFSSRSLSGAVSCSHASRISPNFSWETTLRRPPKVACRHYATPCDAEIVGQKTDEARELRW
jgi:hypothetical protein